MVAAVSSNTTPPNSKVLSRSTAAEKLKRPPLLPSGNDNNDLPLPRCPKPQNVSSRYLSCTVSTNNNKDVTMSSSSSLSSCSSSTTTTSSPNSVCTPKKRFQPAVVNTKPTSAMKDCKNGVRHFGNRRMREMSTRSLSVSFQGESFALPVSKVTKPEKTLERKKASATPARTLMRSRQSNFMTMSVDFTNEKMKLDGTANAVKALRKAINTKTKYEYKKIETPCDFNNSDHARGGARAIAVPARFWQETINLLKRVPSESVSLPLIKNKKLISECKGPNVLRDGPKRGSPLSNRVGSGNNLGNTPSMLSFSADARRGKVGEKNLVDAHVLRLLHNKHLQWRFANAKADSAMMVQRATAQKSLYNAWVTISKLSLSVISKRVEMQQLKQNLKLHALLKKQMLYLDKWDLTERDHSGSLDGAIMALESSSLCLPVLHGAKADIQNLKEAICSAVDVMQAMAVSLYSLVTKAENVNSLASELASAMKTESFLLDQCKNMFSSLTLLEMEDCSLRAHTLQLMLPRPTTEW